MEGGKPERPIPVVKMDYVALLPKHFVHIQGVFNSSLKTTTYLLTLGGWGGELKTPCTKTGLNI